MPSLMPSQMVMMVMMVMMVNGDDEDEEEDDDYVDGDHRSESRLNCPEDSDTRTMIPSLMVMMVTIVMMVMMKMKKNVIFMLMVIIVLNLGLTAPKTLRKEQHQIQPIAQGPTCFCHFPDQYCHQQ